MTVTTTEISKSTRPKFIILEGVDRSGKDSMQDAIDKHTRYKHFVMDRGPIGFKAYCELFNKGGSLFRAYCEAEEQWSLLDDVLVIYLTADTETLLDRCARTNHEILDFDHHKKVYEHYLNTSPLKHIVADTTYRHVDEIVQDLVKEGVL